MDDGEGYLLGCAWHGGPYGFLAPGKFSLRAVGKLSICKNLGQSYGSPGINSSQNYSFTANFREDEIFSKVI